MAHPQPVGPQQPVVPIPPKSPPPPVTPSKPPIRYAKCPNRACGSSWALVGAPVVAVDLEHPEEPVQFGTAMVCAICQTPYIVTTDGVEAVDPVRGVEGRRMGPPQARPDIPEGDEPPDDVRWPKGSRRRGA